MGAARIIAGVFAGFGGLICICGGIYLENPYYFGAGTTILTGMLTFFIGENNGEKKANS